MRWRIALARLGLLRCPARDRAVPRSSDRTMNPHDDAIALQHAIAARAAFPESRGMLALDRACDGPRRLERAIGSAIGAGAMLLLFGWALGRR